MKYTIKELASELNLSRNTVAKVLNGKAGVSPKTEKLVLDKIRSINQSEEPVQPCENPSVKTDNVPSAPFPFPVLYAYPAFISC